MSFLCRLTNGLTETGGSNLTSWPTETGRLFMPGPRDRCRGQATAVPIVDARRPTTGRTQQGISGAPIDNRNTTGNYRSREAGLSEEA